MHSLPFQPLLDWVGQNPHLSGVVVFAIAAAESLVVVGILVPGVAMMLGIGTLVGLDVLPLWSTLFWAAAGAIFGDGLGYWVGHHYDRQLRHVWPLSRYPELIPKGEHFFQRHGRVSILFGRFVGPVRSIIPAVAGMMHMPPIQFYVVNILSAIAWAPVVILPGVAFGASLNVASEVALRFAGVLAVAILLLWFVGWVLHRLFGRLIAKVVLRAYLILNTMLQFYPQRLIVSASVLVLALGLVTAIVWYPALTVPRFEINTQQWWDKDWKLVPAYRDGNLNAPLQLQWQGDLQEIQSVLHSDGWKTSQRLTLKNIMRWLTPDPVLTQLPLPLKSLGSRDAELVLVRQIAQSDEVLVLRFWHLAQKHVIVGNKSVSPDKPVLPASLPLWVGRITRLQVNEIGAGFYFPRERSATSQDLNNLQHALLHASSRIQVKWVQRRHFVDKDLSRGEVMLLRFNAAAELDGSES